MAIGAYAVVAERNRVRLRFQRREQVAQPGLWPLAACNQYGRITEHTSHQRDPGGIVLGLLVQRNKHKRRYVDDCQGVAIRLGTCQHGVRQFAGRARPVDHDEVGLAAQVLLHERQHVAHHDIGAASCGKANEHLDGAIFRPCSAGGKGVQDQQQASGPHETKSHTLSPDSDLPECYVPMAPS